MPAFYSLVVPIYNDAYLADEFTIEFKRTFTEYLKTEDLKNNAELIFVNDGSSNDSISKLKELIKKYDFVKVIDLSRNFGQHIALSCGYLHAKGDFVGSLNVDMQDPPSQIPVLLDHFKTADVDIVHGLRKKYYGPFLERVSSRFFNFLLNVLTGNKSPNAATIRMMNRKFVNAYNSLNERSRYLPGLESWLGFKHGYIETVHQARTKGRSSYNFKKRSMLAMDSIISFSDLPLKLIAISGIVIAMIGFALSLFLIISKLIWVDYQAGYTSTVSIITFIGGIQIMVIGFAALYIGRILKEVQNRPLFVINEKYNF